MLYCFNVQDKYIARPRFSVAAKLPEGLVVHVVGHVRLLHLVRQRLRPEEVGLAARAVHVIAATVLLNLDIASRAKLDEFGIGLRPLIELASAFLLLTDAALLSRVASKELLTAAVRVDAEAVLLSEIAALERARSELTIRVHVSENLIEGKAIELGPSDLIDKGFDFLLVNNLTAVDVRALHADILNDGHNDGNAFPADHGELVV